MVQFRSGGCGHEAAGDCTAASEGFVGVSSLESVGSSMRLRDGGNGLQVSSPSTGGDTSVLVGEPSDETGAGEQVDGGGIEGGSSLREGRKRRVCHSGLSVEGEEVGRRQRKKEQKMGKVTDSMFLSPPVEVMVAAVSRLGPLLEVGIPSTLHVLELWPIVVVVDGVCGDVKNVAHTHASSEGDHLY